MNTHEQFAMRCKTATDCLPQAQYRVHLERLHKDMLAALAAPDTLTPGELADRIERGERWAVQEKTSFPKIENRFWTKP